MADDYTAPVPPRFCPQCGSPLEERLLASEDRLRLVCRGCGHILYINPKVVAAVIPEWGDRFLLLRRAIEPRYGTWTFPGGFVEIDETVEAAAVREAREEVGLEVRLRTLVGVYSRPAPAGPGVVVVVYRGEVTSERICMGREALEARWVLPSEIPWDELSFQTTAWALRDWLAGR